MVAEQRFTLIHDDGGFPDRVALLLETQEVDQLRELLLVSRHEIMHIDNAVL